LESDDYLANLNRVPVEIQQLFRVGGKQLIDLLDYCVKSMQMDPLFLFLVQEYRNAPTALKAVALYDLFCAAQAVAKVSAAEALPPFNGRMQEVIMPIKVSIGALPPVPANPDSQSQEIRRLILPPKYLFDSVASAVQACSESLVQIERQYDPHRTPVENLPDGKMTIAQRHFVDKVWQPAIRPRLVDAGFWRVASVS
jgi:hypothetical protein